MDLMLATSGGPLPPAALLPMRQQMSEPLEDAMNCGSEHEKSVKVDDDCGGLVNAAASTKKAAASRSRGARRRGISKSQLFCKVDGCHASLSSSKAYYQRHRVCATHLAAMVAPIDGVDSRFCQQCGKFQPVVDFDADKRSCRSRLKRHNNRRREQRHHKSQEHNSLAALSNSGAATSTAGGADSSSSSPRFGLYSGIAISSAGGSAAVAGRAVTSGMPAPALHGGDGFSPKPPAALALASLAGGSPTASYGDGTSAFSLAATSALHHQPTRARRESAHRALETLRCIAADASSHHSSTSEGEEELRGLAAQPHHQRSPMKGTTELLGATTDILTGGRAVVQQGCTHASLGTHRQLFALKRSGSTGGDGSGRGCCGSDAGGGTSVASQWLGAQQGRYSHPGVFGIPAAGSGPNSPQSAAAAACSSSHGSPGGLDGTAGWPLRSDHQSAMCLNAHTAAGLQHGRQQQQAAAPHALSRFAPSPPTVQQPLSACIMETDGSQIWAQLQQRHHQEQQHNHMQQQQQLAKQQQFVPKLQEAGHPVSPSTHQCIAPLRLQATASGTLVLGGGAPGGRFSEFGTGFAALATAANGNIKADADADALLLQQHQQRVMQQMQREQGHLDSPRSDAAAAAASAEQQQGGCTPPSAAAHSPSRRSPFSTLQLKDLYAQQQQQHRMAVTSPPAVPVAPPAHGGSEAAAATQETAAAALAGGSRASCLPILSGEEDLGELLDLLLCE